MANTELNFNQIERYLKVFGQVKFLYLWNEFLECSDYNWQKLEKLETKEKQYIFHNWRSGSKIFGMDEFSRLCQKTEDCIINCRTEKINSLVQDCKVCYEKQVSAVKDFFVKMEQTNEK